MAFSYISPSSSTRDEIRFLIGDVDSDDPQFSDDEIDYIETQTASALLAAAYAARLLATKYARLADTTIGDLEVKHSQRSRRYLEMARELEKQGQIEAGTYVAEPVVTGISVTEIDSVDQDTDKVGSAFKKGMFDNPPFSHDDPIRDELV